MKFVIQRVSEANVKIDSNIAGSIGKGLLVLIGISNEDDFVVADKMIKKLVNMRIFEDENGKTNLNLASVDGELLLISQFTLYADCKHGNRPSFINAGSPEMAENLYDYVVEQLKSKVETKVETGAFGADMKVSLINDGPFTIVLDSKELI
ncbi:MAG: D-aminoacyl-tRNA deacylase [Eubacterium sp.]|nr:D-aminoacyl-tRNA deacylase [Eubacterium sp.]